MLKINNRNYLNYHLSNNSQEWRTFMLHMFIQWLAHKDIFNLWLDEMLDENDELDYTIGTRANRLHTCANVENYLRYSFGFDQTKQRGLFWMAYSNDWKKQYRLICRYIKGEPT